MKAYICRVYHFNYLLEQMEKPEWPLLQRPSVASCVVYGWTARHAAAKAYVAECGMFRASILQPLGCPISVIQFETSVSRVWRAMKVRNTWTGTSYYFDNGTEIFYVTSCLHTDYLRELRQIHAIEYSTN